MTISDVGKHLGVSWHMVKDIHKRYLNRKYGKPSLKHLNSIAIDEIYNGKKHKYLTIVLNLETGAVVFVGKGKGADALSPFWEKLGRRKKKIKSVAIDMSAAYTRAVSDRWLLAAESSGVGMLARFSKTLRSHRVGILNYYEHRITTGALEGTNAKIRVMQRKAYGFRDEEYLKLKIYALHETKMRNIA